MVIKRSDFTAFLKKRENWLIPGFCCLLLFLGIGMAWDYYFDLNDDVLIRDILSGVYTGEPEALTAQLLWPLSALLAGLYRVLPGVPVFGAFLWLCQAGSLFLILKRSLDAVSGWAAPGGVEMIPGGDRKPEPVGKPRFPARAAGTFSMCETLKKLCLNLLETLLIAACLLYHLVFVQYTVTAGLLAAAAIFTFLTVKEREGERAAAFWLRCLPAALLFWIAFCLRSEMGLLLLPLAGVAGIWKWAARRPVFTGRNAASFVGLFALILAGLLGCFGADRLACSDPEWQEFEDLFDARTQVYDFYDASLRSFEKNREFYEKLGLTETQCELLVNYNYGADDAIDAQVMEQIAAYGEETRGTFAHSLSEGVWLYVQRLMNNRSIVPDDQLPWLFLEGGSAALLLAAALVRWGAARKQKRQEREIGNERERKERKAFPKGSGILWKLLLLGAVRSGLWMYLILRERVPERISHPLYFCELVMLAWLLLDAVCGMREASARQDASEEQKVPEKQKAPEEQPVSRKQPVSLQTSVSWPEGLSARIIRIAAMVLSLAAVAVWLPREVERTGAEYARREQVNAVNLAALSRYRQENLYLADVMSTVDFSEKLFTEKIRPGNYDLLGGWMCKSPHSVKKLAAFGYESMGQAVLSGENIRFVGEADTDWSWLPGLLAEHGTDGQLVLEEEITAEGRSLYIWRLERS